jgi:hypothetical protein
MGNTAKVGILGFLAGAAEQRLNLEDEMRKEDRARRMMHAEELKQRRMAKFKMSIEADDEARRIKDMSGGDDQFWLDIGLTRTPTDVTTARQAVTRYQGETLKEDDPVFISPGTTVTTRGDLTSQLEESGGNIRTPDRTASNSDQTRLVNDVMAQVKTTLNSRSPAFTSAAQSALEEASLGDIADEPEKRNAYASMTQAIAMAKVQSSVRESMRRNPNLINSLNAEDVISMVEAEQQAAQNAITSLGTVYATAMSRRTGVTPANSHTVAREILEKGFKDADGKQVNPREDLIRMGYWSPTVGNIMIETMMQTAY